MPPKPRPPEDESLGIPNAETVFISSNCPTASKLCDVCFRIPAWFWTRELEVGEEVSVELQPFKEMEVEAQNGCALCQALCKSYGRLGDCRNTLLVSGPGKLVKRKDSIKPHKRLPEYWINCLFNKVESWFISLCPIPSSWRPRPIAAADENSNILLMQDWMNNCQLNHTKCNNINKGFLPTRLLDLEAFERQSPSFKDDIKLVRSASFQFHNPGSVPRYITLSHCWGPPEKRPIITTHKNLAVRMERISFSDLPRTFQDAVVLTRKLGEQFLWIDSLCIIQDDEDDWANEASMMAKVYTQSYCTLAALSSRDSTEGLKMSSKVETDKDLIIDLGANDGHHRLLNVRLFEAWPKIWTNEYNGNVWTHLPRDRDLWEGASPLRYRAWALQEKELSTRSIHFGLHQLLWECRELKGTAQVPWYQLMDPHDVLDNDMDNGMDNNMERYTWAESEPENTIFYNMTLRWVDLCREYSSRSLTKETDKLLALSGIARSFQEYFPNDKYIAGIWSCHLPLALLWRPELLWKPAGSDIERSATEYISPSWSWTSQGITIRYDSFIALDLARSRRMTSNTSREADKWLDELEVVGIKGQPKHGDDYGALKEGAALELKGALLFELDSGLELPEPYKVYSRRYRVYFRKDGVRAGSFILDAPGLPQGKFVCLGIFYSKYDFDGVMGVILREHTREGCLVYSRVAYVDGLDPSLWNASERRQITLI